MTILLAALGGAAVTGLLLILSQYFQTQREEHRQQRDFARAVRGESLDRIKLAIDTGVTITTQLEEWSEGRAVQSTITQIIYEYNVALNGALVSATTLEAEQLKRELINLSTLTDHIADTIQNDTFTSTLLGEAINQLALIENQYTELKVKWYPTKPESPFSRWWNS